MVPDAARAAATLVPIDLFDRQRRLAPDRTAVEADGVRWSYRELDQRAARLRGWLRAQGLVHGDRVALLAQNQPFFVELALAALGLGVIVATLNPRMSAAEAAAAIALVQPRLTLVTARHAPTVDGAGASAGRVRCIDDALHAEVAAGAPAPRDASVAPEDIAFILYTSGTTGAAKGAMLSHRAMIARMMVYVLDYGVDGGDTFVAWSPLCHMASIELTLGMLMLGGLVAVLDGLDLPRLCDHLERDSLANLTFFPGIVDEVLAYLRERRPRVRRLKKFGSLADLYAPAQLAELSALLGVRYANTFGSTETGMPPASAGVLSADGPPYDYAKAQSSLCTVRLVDEAGHDVPRGAPGELVMRGPTLFSGYWNAPDATADAFRDGWYHSGDVFVESDDGRVSFVDRVKYLIKSGGENIYPAEIERVVLAHPDVAEAVVVRRRDARWGEVPVLVASVRAGRTVTADELVERCRSELAAFKRPREVRFVPEGALPRNGTGKIVRRDVERWVDAGATGVPPAPAGGAAVS